MKKVRKARAPRGLAVLAEASMFALSSDYLSQKIFIGSRKGSDEDQ